MPDRQQRGACEGCPRRRLLLPYVESLAFNVMYNGINHLRGHPTARIGFRSWGSNLKHGFEWDNNPWLVNQIGHPYQGSNYFTAGRAHGLSFWEATSVAAFGSATWEFFFENNRASLNDLINTTLGGIALGEVLHRAAWLVRRPDGPSGRREMAGTAIDPIGGLIRTLSGDARRVSPKPPGMMPSSLVLTGAAGVRWQGSNVHEARSTARPFVDVELQYGDVYGDRAPEPFDAFVLQLSAGGGGIISHAGIRGRLFGRALRASSPHRFTLFQTFEYIQNHAFDFGGQGVEAEVTIARMRPSGATLRLTAAGGVSVLGAVNSLLPPPSGTVLPPGAGSDGTRIYDYGPGARWSGSIQVLGSGAPRFAITYHGYHVSVVDGTRSNHVLQRLRVDGLVPLGRTLAAGAAAEFFFRKAYFWAAGDRTDESPQFNVFLAWRVQ